MTNTIYTRVRTLKGIKRLDNSENGNLNYKLYFACESPSHNEVVRTKEDSMVTNKIDNTYINKMCYLTYSYDETGKAFLKDIDII